MQRIYPSGPVIEVKHTVSISEGGTGANNAPQALINLGLIPRSQLGVPNGVIPLDENNKIPLEFLDGLPETSTELDGPASLEVEETGVYKITNFDSRYVYDVDAEHGSVSIVGDEITYTAPMLHTVPGGFSINALFYSINISPIERIPNAVVITFPASDLTQNVASQLFIASPWSTDYPEDELQGYRWQVALDAAFTNIIRDDFQTSGSMDRITQTGIPPNTTIYVRTATVGQYGYQAPWSNVRSMTRPMEQKPATPTFLQPPVNAVQQNALVELVTSAFVGTAPGDTHFNSDWQVSTSPTFDTILYQLLNNNVHLTELDYTIADQNVVHYFRVRHRGTSGWVSDYSVPRQITYVPASPPDAPTILTPNAGTQIVAPGPTASVLVTTSAFSGGPGTTHDATDWQFATDALFQNPLAGGGVSTTDLLSRTVVFPTGTLIFARVRHRNDAGDFGAYSPIVSFYLNYYNQPSILYPVDGGTNYNRSFTGSSSAPSDAAGPVVGAVTVRWEVSTTNTFSNIIATYTDTGPVVNSIEMGPFNLGLTLYTRMRYEFQDGNNSPWSSTVDFTIAISEIGHIFSANMFDIPVDESLPSLTMMAGEGFGGNYSEDVLLVGMKKTHFHGNDPILDLFSTYIRRFDRDPITNTWTESPAQFLEISSIPISASVIGDTTTIEVRQIFHIQGSQYGAILVVTQERSGPDPYESYQIYAWFDIDDPTEQNTVLTAPMMEELTNDKVFFVYQVNFDPLTPGSFTAYSVQSSTGDFQSYYEDGTLVPAEVPVPAPSWVNNLLSYAAYTTEQRHQDLMALIRTPRNTPLFYFRRFFDSTDSLIGYSDTQDSLVGELEVLNGRINITGSESEVFFSNHDLSRVFVQELDPLDPSDRSFVYKEYIR